MYQIEENKRFDEILHVYIKQISTTSTITYSPMGEQQGLLEMLDVVSTPADNAMGTPMMAPQDGRCGELRAGLDLCEESSTSLSLSLSLSLPLPPPPPVGFIMNWETHAEQLSTLSFLRLRFQRLARTTYYSLLLELHFASQGA